MAQDKLKTNLLKLLKIFNGYPHIFVSFLLKHNAFTEDFKNKLNKSVVHDKPKKFHDMEKAINFYSTLLVEEPTTALNMEDNWNSKLLKALLGQKYEEAARIRDIMHKNGFKIKI